MEENIKEHALKALENLFQLEAEKAEMDIAKMEKNEKKGKSTGRIKDGSLFIPSRAVSPPWNKRPHEWAPDWCAGWAFPVSHTFAEALGVQLTKRSRTVYLTDAVGNRIPERDKDGNIKKDKKGKILYEKFIQKYLIWTQSTAFCFHAGHTIHTYPHEYADRAWKDQLPHNDITIRIIDARESEPVNGPIKRDPGLVVFEIYKADKEKNCLFLTDTKKTTQDGFVRFLITGELEEKDADE